MPAGMAPKSADEINLNVGMVLRQFSSNKLLVNQYHDWLAAEDLKTDPYNMSAEDETLIKSALTDLDAGLDALDMTFVNRLIGLPT